jgi:hypothetical protein
MLKEENVWTNEDPLVTESLLSYFLLTDLDLVLLIPNWYSVTCYSVIMICFLGIQSQCPNECLGTYSQYFFSLQNGPIS